jgi:hypothetical protein
MRTLKRLSIGLAVLCFAVGHLFAVEAPWTEIPPAQWKGVTAAEVPALNRRSAAAVALPAKEAKPLAVATVTAQPPGLYEVRLILRPSHVADAVAFNAGLRVRVGGGVAAEFPGQFFTRQHQPETRTLQMVQSGSGPLGIVLEAFASPKSLEEAKVAAVMKAGGPKLGAGDGLDHADGDKWINDQLELSLTPAQAVYYLVDKIEFRPLSRSGRVAKIEINKIRYKPGETLKGSAVVADAGRKGGTGTLNLYLEHSINERTKAKSVPVTLKPESQTIAFEISLPKKELGYAVVAEFVSADGNDHSEAAEYFTIAENFQRTALFGASAGGTRDTELDEPAILKALNAARSDYYNAVEYPFWAEDDLLALTPSTDWWFSGQANYHMNKQTIQRQIKLAHEQGIAMVSYGKWQVDGPVGWEAVYDRPQDFTGAYSQPIGSWDPHNTWIFDLRRNNEQVPYTPRPVINTKAPCFDPWWNEFVGIGPNSSLSIIRTAAEEMAASIDMFGWDAIRWDGHIRTGWNATGRSGQYEAWAARQTQTLTRYFKDVVAKKHPEFRHGYNYFLIEKDKKHNWAKEDFELDELSRDGGLLMNESIGNASAGWTFAEIANNLQVEGDLSRERGAFYLGISFAGSPRDRIIESALWAAAGCRPYNSGMTRETRRYLTRFAEFTLDERLRRLSKPEGILKPQTETKLWWQPFVYETPTESGRRRLVVNLLNLPLADKRPSRDGKSAPVWTMPPGTDPVTFALTLPPGLKATAANIIDPQTLVVQPLALKSGSFEVPAVAAWSVLVVDMTAEAKAPLLSDLFGAPKTFGVERDTLKDEQRLAPVEIELTKEVWEVNKNMSSLQPAWEVKREAEIAAFDAMTPEQRVAALKDKLAKTTPESVSGDWWKGGVLPDDLKRKNVKVDYGDLTPQRNGRFDIFYGRGAMDHRLRMPQAIAGLERFSIHDAPFSGSFRGGGLGGMALWNNVPWQRYSEFDLLLFTGIPYAAIGLENCYGLVPYVKAGGAVFFTGGEWAFGKGGYLMTVLDRELLPVRCVEFKDTRTLPLEKPAVMEPGKDFAELGFKADFTAKPSFWVYNQVLLREEPGVKVFLTSAKGPVLVGWQVGKGRVACLLLDHRGKSEKGVTAFFDWKDWPGLAESVMRWLAPEAGIQDKARTAGINDAEAKRGLDDPESEKRNTAEAQHRNYAQTLALPLIESNDRVAEGRALVEQWNAQEKKVRDEWTSGKGFSPAAPELPCLDAETLFRRIGWLAYLARHVPSEFGPQFVRQWLMISVYQDYCGRSAGNKRPGDWSGLSAALGQLRKVTTPDVERLRDANPKEFAEGCAQANFTKEYFAARELLGNVSPAKTRPILERLRTAKNPDLAAFAQARLRQSP